MRSVHGSGADGWEEVISSDRKKLLQPALVYQVALHHGITPPPCLLCLRRPPDCQNSLCISYGFSFKAHYRLPKPIKH